MSLGFQPLVLFQLSAKQAEATHCEPCLPVGGLIPALPWGRGARWSLHTLLYCKGLLRKSHLYIAYRGQEGFSLAESASYNGSATIHSHTASQFSKAQSLMQGQQDFSSSVWLEQAQCCTQVALRRWRKESLSRVYPYLDMANFILPKSVHQGHSKASIEKRKLFSPHHSFLGTLHTITLSDIFLKLFPWRLLGSPCPVEHRPHDHPGAIRNLLPVLLSNYKEKQANVSNDEYFHRRLSQGLLPPCLVLCKDPFSSRGEAVERAAAQSHSPGPRGAWGLSPGEKGAQGHPPVPGAPALSTAATTGSNHSKN